MSLKHLVMHVAQADFSAQAATIIINIIIIMYISIPGLALQVSPSKW